MYLLENEIWKKYPDAPFTFYEFSNLGRVKNSRTGKILKPGLDSQGYQYCILNCNGKKKPLKVHRGVLRAFNDIPNHKEMVIDHINNIHTDNKLENLQWLKRKENIDKAIKEGRMRGAVRLNPIVDRKKKPDSKIIQIRLHNDLIELINKKANDEKIDISLYIENILKENIQQ